MSQLHLDFTRSEVQEQAGDQAQAEHQAGGAVRCGFCPGASLAVQRRSRAVCARCRPIVLGQQETCPLCGSLLLLDPDAEDETGPCVVGFCTGCELSIVVQPEVQ